MIVLDTSAAVDYLVRRGDGDWVEERLEADPNLHAPHLMDVEVVGALRRLVRHGDLTVRRAERGLEDLLALDVTRYSHVPFLSRVWELRDNLKASDATFIALAEALSADLVTTDRALASAPGVRVRIFVP